MELEIEGPNNVDRGFTRVGSLEGLKSGFEREENKFLRIFLFSYIQY